MSQLDECPSNNIENLDRNEENDNQEGIPQYSYKELFNSNKMTIIQFVVGVSIAVICFIVFTSKPVDLEKEYYNTMGASIMSTQAFWDFKYSHDLVEKIMNSIELKSKNSYVSHQQNTLGKNQLKKYKPDLKLSLKSQLKYDKLPTDLDTKIDLAIRQAGYLKSGKDTYIQIDLSDAYGGTHYLGFGVLGFVEDPKDNGTVMIGVSVYREELNEQDHVRLKTQNLDKQDVERYIQFELYQRIYDKMDENYRRRINSKADFKRITNKPTNKVNCQYTQTHIIFINDKSGSMYGTDSGLSQPEYGFIKTAGNLENRLGSLYSAIQDFVQVRHDNNCDDMVSAILFDSTAQVAAKKKRLVKDSRAQGVTFVKDYLIKHKPGGGTNFGKGFEKANALINYAEDTLVIFLTDGESSDDGASDVVSTWKQNMGNKLKLYCVVLGNDREKSVVRKICDKGDGEMKQTLNGEELIETYNKIVWKEIRREKKSEGSDVSVK